MDILEKAIIYAVEAHSGMKCTGTERPYILHPLETAAIVGSMTSDREILAAAVLHDVVEDTTRSIADIRADFGFRIAEWVAAESENKRKALPAESTWRIRKEKTLRRLNKTTDLAVKMICLGDNLSNIRAIYRDYQAIGNPLWERFNPKGPALYYWYYHAIAEALSELSYFSAWQEYNELVEKVFQSGITVEKPRPFIQEHAWRFCVCGNIVAQHIDDEGIVRYGTKAFTSGTKVYIDGKYKEKLSPDDKVLVIGKNRFGKYATERIPVQFIENIRAQRVFHPIVLSIMSSDYDFEWQHAASDRKATKEFVKLWKETMAEK